MNLIPLMTFLLTGAYLSWKTPAIRGFALVFTGVVLANRMAIEFFPEHRSYFTQLCFTASLLTCLRALFSQGADLRPDRDRGLAGLLFLWAVAALVIHYIGALIVGALLGVIGLECLRRGYWRWAGLLILAAVVAGTMLGASLISQSTYLKATAPHFWINTGPVAAFRYMVTVISAVVKAQPVADVAAVLTVLALFLGGRWADWGPGDWIKTVRRDALTFVAPVGLGLIAAVGAVLIVNQIKPVVEMRYLIPMTAIAGALLAAICANILVARWWLFGLFLVNVAATSALETRHVVRDNRWNTYIHAIRVQVQACPETRVYGLNPGFISNYNKPANEPEVEDWGYGEMARAHGFTLTVLDPMKASPIVLARHCPTLFWGAHIEGVMGARELSAAPFTRALPPGVSLAAAKLFIDPHANPVETGFLLTLPPSDSPPT